MIAVHPASTTQAELAYQIVLEAFHWLNAQQQPLWKLDEFPQSLFENAAQQGELFVAFQDGEPVGTLMYQLEDRLYWPQLAYGQSAFIHKVAVRRKVAGQGVGRAMVEWAVERTKALGIAYLRLDTAFDRPKLMAFYQNCGFVHVADAFDGLRRLALMERAV